MIEQLSVFLENRKGRLADMARVLGDAGYDMKALMVADTAEFGVVRLICDRPYGAKRVLEERGFGVSLTEVVGVAVPNKPGGLAEVLEILDREDINIEYAYVFVRPGEEQVAVDIFRLEDAQGGQAALERAGIRLVKAADIYERDAG